MVKFYVPLLGMLTIMALFYDSEATKEINVECVKQLFTLLEQKVEGVQMVNCFNNCMNSEEHKNKDFVDISECGKNTLETFKQRIKNVLTKTKFKAVRTGYENFMERKEREHEIDIPYFLDDALNALQDELPETEAEVEDEEEG